MTDTSAHLGVQQLRKSLRDPKTVSNSQRKGTEWAGGGGVVARGFVDVQTGEEGQRPEVVSVAMVLCATERSVMCV